METMVDNFDRTPNRCRAIILEIERFITEHADEQFKTRHVFAKNYFKQLKDLLECNQLYIARDEDRNIVTVCGWARMHQDDMWQVNKVRWTLPTNLCEGNVLYVSFYASRSPRTKDVRRELTKRYASEIDEIFWFSVPKQKFVRRRNILKERTLCNKTAA